MRVVPQCLCYNAAVLECHCKRIIATAPLLDMLRSCLESGPSVLWWKGMHARQMFCPHRVVSGFVRCKLQGPHYSLQSGTAISGWSVSNEAVCVQSCIGLAVLATCTAHAWRTTPSRPVVQYAARTLQCRLGGELILLAYITYITHPLLPIYI